MKLYIAEALQALDTKSLEAMNEKYIDSDDDFSNNNLLIVDDDTELVNSSIDAQEVLSHLEERERFIIEHRFGINCKHPETLEEVGAQLKLTRERVRQIQEIATKYLRSILKSRVKESRNQSFLPSRMWPCSCHTVGDFRYGCKHWPSVVPS